MKNSIITISDNGIVTVPDNVRMMDFEVAQLFGVYAQTIRTNVKSILKSGVCQGDFSDGGVVYGNTIIPEYFGLDMITTIAFRIESPQATIFREWVIRRITKTRTIHQPPMFIQMPNNWVLSIPSAMYILIGS